MTNYMVDRLGYPKDLAFATSKPLLRMTSLEKPNTILDFLCRCGSLLLPQLHCFVRCRPSIFTIDIPPNLLPKLSLFHSLLSNVDASPNDPSLKELIILVSACASTFGYRVSHLTSALNLLCSLFTSDNCKVASTLHHCPCLLTNNPKKVLAHNLAILLHRGLDATALSKKASIILILSPKRLEVTDWRGGGEELRTVMGRGQRTAGDGGGHGGAAGGGEEGYCEQ